MQVLILGDDYGQQARLGAAMMKKGFQVICVESAAAASSYIRSEMIEVLILTETRSGRIIHSCAGVSESRNRAVSVIVISGRTGPALDELFEEIPQLYGVMGLDMAPAMVAALALASILPQEVEMTTPRDAMPSGPMPQHMPRLPEPMVDLPTYGQAAPLSRTLIQPKQRPASPSMPLVSAPGAQMPVRAPFDQGKALAAMPADIGPDLAALERELELVNRDRPSVLAATIADELPRWSLTAPKLATLTDWTPTAATLPLSGAAGRVPVTPAAANGLLDRRLALGMTLQ